MPQSGCFNGLAWQTYWKIRKSHRYDPPDLANLFGAVQLELVDAFVPPAEPRQLVVPAVAPRLDLGLVEVVSLLAGGDVVRRLRLRLDRQVSDRRVGAYLRGAAAHKRERG